MSRPCGSHDVRGPLGLDPRHGGIWSGNLEGVGRMDGSIGCFWSAPADDLSRHLDQFWMVGIDQI